VIPANTIIREIRIRYQPVVIKNKYQLVNRKEGINSNLNNLLIRKAPMNALIIYDKYNDNICQLIYITGIKLVRFNIVSIIAIIINE
jgi:hypothetical protein